MRIYLALLGLSLITIASLSFEESDPPGPITTYTTLVDFVDEIETEKLSLINARGNGKSSGNAVEGYLVNNTPDKKRINIYLGRPLYFVNSGEGQNMIATTVVTRNGGYYSDGENSFIEIHPKEMKAITFIAYCVDFYKNNPASYESFSIKHVPSDLDKLFNGIIASKEDNIVAIQLALWLAQGISISEIEEKFKFSYADEMLARELLRQYN